MKTTVRHAAYHRGMTLVEGVVYAGLMALIAMLFMSSVVAFFRSFVSIRASRAVSAAAGTALERITRETRNANAVRDADSIFGTSPGKLSLDTPDGSGGIVPVDFFVENGRVMMRRAAEAARPLTASTTAADVFLVTKLVSGESVGARVLVGFRDTRLQDATTTLFSTSIILRGSY